jgi:hypothetical protein
MLLHLVQPKLERRLLQPVTRDKTFLSYVIDKGANQFWICTALYNFQDLTANNGDCVKLPTDIGRPSLSETYDIRAVTGSAAISAFLPVFWFIEPTSGEGEVQFCAVRHAGIMRTDEFTLTARRVFNWPNTVDLPTGYSLGRH